MKTLTVAQVLPYMSYTESFRTFGTLKYPFYKYYGKNAYFTGGLFQTLEKSIYGQFKTDTAHFYCYAQFDSGANITGGAWIDSSRWADSSLYSDTSGYSLNSDLLDGHHGTYYTNHTFTWTRATDSLAIIDSASTKYVKIQSVDSADYSTNSGTSDSARVAGNSWHLNNIHSGQFLRKDKQDSTLYHDIYHIWHPESVSVLGMTGVQILGSRAVTKNDKGVQGLYVKTEYKNWDSTNGVANSEIQSANFVTEVTGASQPYTQYFLGVEGWVGTEAGDTIERVQLSAVRGLADALHGKIGAGVDLNAFKGSVYSNSLTGYQKGLYLGFATNGRGATYGVYAPMTGIIRNADMYGGFYDVQNDTTNINGQKVYGLYSRARTKDNASSSILRYGIWAENDSNGAAGYFKTNALNKVNAIYAVGNIQTTDTVVAATVRADSFIGGIRKQATCILSDTAIKIRGDSVLRAGLLNGHTLAYHNNTMFQTVRYVGVRDSAGRDSLIPKYADTTGYAILAAKQATCVLADTAIKVRFDSTGKSGVSYSSHCADSINLAALAPTAITYYPLLAVDNAGHEQARISTAIDYTGTTFSAPSFAGALTGNVTGNCTGSSGSCTGNAATVTTNANLTGDATSVGNATTVVQSTGAFKVGTFLAMPARSVATLANTDTLISPTNSFVSITGPTAGFKLVGLATPSPVANNVIFLMNNTSQVMTLKTLTGFGLPAGYTRINTLGADIATTGAAMIILMYDQTGGSWTVCGSAL